MSCSTLQINFFLRGIVFSRLSLPSKLTFFVRGIVVALLFYPPNYNFFPWNRSRSSFSTLQNAIFLRGIVVSLFPLPSKLQFLSMESYSLAFLYPPNYNFSPRNRSHPPFPTLQNAISVSGIVVILLPLPSKMHFSSVESYPPTSLYPLTCDFFTLNHISPFLHYSNYNFPYRIVLPRIPTVKNVKIPLSYRSFCYRTFIAKLTAARLQPSQMDTAKNIFHLWSYIRQIMP